MGVCTRSQNRRQKQADAEAYVQKPELATRNNQHGKQYQTISPRRTAKPGKYVFCKFCFAVSCSNPKLRPMHENNEQEKIRSWRKDEDCALGTNVLLDIDEMVDHAETRNQGKGSHGDVPTNLHSHHAVGERDADSGLGGRGQQDAHEFLQLIIFSLQRLEDLYASKKAKKSGGTSLFNNTWSGSTHVTKTCTICGAASITEDMWNVQTLFITSTCKYLADCFQNTARRQVLDGENIVTCEKCERRSKAHEQSRIMAASDMLIVHFNLTTSRKNGTGKLRGTVAVPTTHVLNIY